MTATMPVPGTPEWRDWVLGGAEPLPAVPPRRDWSAEPGAEPGASGAQDLTTVKANFLLALQDIADRLLVIGDMCSHIDAQWFADGFNSAGTNAIAQTDCIGPSTHFTPTIATNVVVAVEAIMAALPAGTKNNLRQALSKPVP